jgi:hypothetical protein
MDRVVTIAQLKATQATLTAAYAQLEAQIVALEADARGDEAPEEPRCSACGSLELAPAGDVWVCAGCGANIPKGEIHG